MTKNFKSVKISAILCLLLLSTFSGFGFFSTVRAAPLIQFGSYIDIVFNTTELNKPFEIDVSVNIPVKVLYWTEIPRTYKLLPYPLNNLIYFGRPVGPMQKIHLEIVNQPEWANVYFSDSELLVQIPVEGDTPVEVWGNLVISPRIEAPAVSQKVIIKATCESIYRLRGIDDYTESTEFTPAFVPTVQISTDTPIRNAGPRETVEFRIDVKNLGNKLTKVTPDLIDPALGWNAIINPTVREINPGEETYFTFSVITPFNFGWHDEVESFEVEFNSEIYPYRADSPKDKRSVYTTVYNYGFATSGVEIAIAAFIILLLVAIIIYTKRYKNK